MLVAFRDHSSLQDNTLKVMSRYLQDRHSLYFGSFGDSGSINIFSLSPKELERKFESHLKLSFELVDELSMLLPLGLQYLVAHRVLKRIKESFLEARFFENISGKVAVNR